MWTRADLKRNGKIAFKRNWFLCAFACFVIIFLGGEAFGSATIGYRATANSQSQQETAQQIEQMIGNMSAAQQEMLAGAAIAFLLAFIITFVIMIVYQMLIGNIMTVGGRRFFMENREHKTEMSQLFWAFKGGRYSNVVIVMLARTVKTFLWSLLFVVPGIIKSYEYLMIPYILADNPQIDRRRAFELSRGMMDGHKMEAFVLGLSFIGWIIVGGLLAGVPNIIYTNPYMMATFSEYYAALKAEALYKGLTSETELPGFRNPMPQMDTDMYSDVNMM